MKIDNKTIIDLIKNIEVNGSQKISFRGLTFEVKNKYSELIIELKPNILLKIIVFFILAFILSFIGVALVAIITNGNQKLVGFGIIPVLLLLFFTNSISKQVFSLFYRKRISEFHKLIEGIELKSIENTLNSKNPFFIEKLFELKKGKLSKSLIELKKQDFIEDLEMDFITKQEYQYLLKIIENEQ